MRKGIVGGLFLWLIHNFLAGGMEVRENYGISLGISLGGYWWVMLMVIVLLLIKDKDWGWSIMMAGGVANILDRLIFGYVRDYWKLPFFDIYNNLNDWLIFSGLIWKMKSRLFLKMRV